MNLKLNHLIIIGGMIPLQSMAIFFWIDIISSTIEAPIVIINISGIAISIMVEIASLWFWFNRETFFAVVTSAVVIGSAAYHVTASSRNDLQVAEKITSKQDQVKVMTNVLDSIKDKKYPMTIQKAIKIFLNSQTTM